ncbi:MAG: hypothetical protein ACO2PN_21575 [Pyrobaculum sp.]
MQTFVGWLRKRRNVPDLNWFEIWILFILAAGGGWVGIDKIMAIAFLLERVYGGPNGLVRVCFVHGPWSEDVIVVLKRLVSLGLAEELGGAYRLSESGKAVVESYPMNDVKIRYPYANIKFFINWNMNSLKEYIRVNYPGWA